MVVSFNAACWIRTGECISYSFCCTRLAENAVAARGTHPFAQEWRRKKRESQEICNANLTELVLWTLGLLCPEHWKHKDQPPDQTLYNFFIHLKRRTTFSSYIELVAQRFLWRKNCDLFGRAPCSSLWPKVLPVVLSSFLLFFSISRTNSNSVVSDANLLSNNRTPQALFLSLHFSWLCSYPWL